LEFYFLGYYRTAHTEVTEFTADMCLKEKKTSVPVKVI